jgi:hypothetical protein
MNVFLVSLLLKNNNSQCIWASVADPDPHHFGKPDPDLDPHQSEKQNPDPDAHQSQN